MVKRMFERELIGVRRVGRNVREILGYRDVTTEQAEEMEGFCEGGRALGALSQARCHGGTQPTTFVMTCIVHTILLDGRLPA